MSKMSPAEPMVTFERGAYLERDMTLQRLRAAIAAIKQPRGGRQFVMGLTRPHWLRTPTLPKDPDNEAQMRKCRQEDAAISGEERRLEDIAYEAADVLKTKLLPWSAALLAREEALGVVAETCGLAEADREDIAAIQRDNERFTRTCNEWCEKLRF